MGSAEGKCDVCGAKVTAETLEDKTDYLHYGDKVTKVCRHYPEGTILSDLEKLRIDLEEIKLPVK